MGFNVWLSHLTSCVTSRLSASVPSCGMKRLVRSNEVTGAQVPGVCSDPPTVSVP